MNSVMLLGGSGLALIVAVLIALAGIDESGRATAQQPGVNPLQRKLEEERRRAEQARAEAEEQRQRAEGGSGQGGAGEEARPDPREVGADGQAADRD